MERYGNLSGTSGVAAYEIGPDSITVEFVGGHAYLYTYASTGRARVEQMQRLAVQGKGLSAYIARHVREAYAARVR